MVIFNSYVKLPEGIFRQSPCRIFHGSFCREYFYTPLNRRPVFWYRELPHGSISKGESATNILRCAQKFKNTRHLHHFLWTIQLVAKKITYYTYSDHAVDRFFFQQKLIKMGICLKKHIYFRIICVYSIYIHNYIIIRKY